MKVTVEIGRSPYLSRWRRWEVLVHYGRMRDDGTYQGGSRWVGLFFTRWGAARVYRRQRVRPAALRPQTVELLHLPGKGGYRKMPIQSEVLER